MRMIFALMILALGAFVLIGGSTGGLLTALGIGSPSANGTASGIGSKVGAPPVPLRPGQPS